MIYRFFFFALCCVGFSTYSASSAITHTSRRASAPIADSTASASSAPVIKIGGYVDMYYAMDNDKGDNRALTEVLNLERNKFDINIASIYAEVTAEKYRGRIAIQNGEVVRVSWTSPFTFFPSIQEAYGGVRIADGVWLDVGYFFTHIGGETVLAKDNWFSSLALTTIYEPFYQAGARLTYDPSDKVTLQLHLLNGYNRLEDNNANKSIGWLIGYHPNADFSANLTGIVGNEQDADQRGALRVYNDFNMTWQITPKFGIKVESDFGIQGATPLVNNNQSTLMWSALLGARYSFSDQWSFSGRAEYYNDQKGMLTAPIIKGSVLTGCLEFRPVPNAYLRWEGRFMNLDKTTSSIFTGSNGLPTNTRFGATMNFGLFF